MSSTTRPTVDIRMPKGYAQDEHVEYAGDSPPRRRHSDDTATPPLGVATPKLNPRPTFYAEEADAHLDKISSICASMTDKLLHLGVPAEVWADLNALEREVGGIRKLIRGNVKRS